LPLKEGAEGKLGAVYKLEARNEGEQGEQEVAERKKGDRSNKGSSSLRVDCPLEREKIFQRGGRILQKECPLEKPFLFFTSFQEKWD
jgi:hypothetical protein